MAGLPFTALAACFFILWGESQGLTIHTDRSRFNVTAGGDATFSVRPSVKVRSGNWGFKDTTIVTWIGSSVDVDNAFTSRAELLLPNGSLLLKSVTTSDSGDYTVTMTPEVGDQQTATIALLVIEKELLTPSLSTGAIVGIVIGAVAGLLCLSGLVWFMYKKCGKRSKAGTKSIDCKMICQENKLTSQTDYAAVERKPPQQPRLEASSNGTKAASSQAKDGDIIYTSPTIVNQRPHPSKETVIDNKTDYAELKYK